MRAVTDHYSQLLAPVYLWMAGGSQKALPQGAEDLVRLQLVPSRNAAAIDLGAGFGMHSIPLARLGFAVTAIDTSAILLAELRRLGADLPIRAIEDDLLNFTAHMATIPGLILCMGDTITHLPTPDAVALLCGRVAHSLAPGGRCPLHPGSQRC
ncbi:MAG TPA: class I SAM-dependent methyltransferase [Steroidobacteraceae bacterium]|nr:class I SAM-dependent methyltransferase [Steroidobacteraceae bacterium]